MRVIMSAVLLFFSLSAGAGAPRCEDIFLVPTRTLRTGKWSQPQLIEILQGLAALGIAINAKAIERDADGRVLAYLQAQGLDATAKQFYKAVQRHFGPWDNVLRAAGFDPDTIRGEHWSQDNIVSALKGLSAAGIALNSRHVIDDPEGLVAKFLSDNGFPGSSPSSF